MQICENPSYGRLLFSQCVLIISPIPMKTSQNKWKRLKMGQNRFLKKGMNMGQNSSKHVKAGENGSKEVQTGENSYKRVKIVTNGWGDGGGPRGSESIIPRKTGRWMKNFNKQIYWNGIYITTYQWTSQIVVLYLMTLNFFYKYVEWARRFLSGMAF